MSNKIEETSYNEIVDNFIETLRQRKFYLFNMVDTSYSDIIDDEIEKINKVFKLYKNNKF